MSKPPSLPPRPNKPPVKGEKGIAMDGYVPPKVAPLPSAKKKN